jgi:ketosteroid isomerase-like protein
MAAVLIPLLPAAGMAQPPTSTAKSDRQTLIALENEWLSEGTPTNMERILAPDFVHPLPCGRFLTRSEQIVWAAKRKQTTWPKHHFAELRVRLYGDAGIVNGIVVATGKSGQVMHKTVFTDVFVRRNGRWQAVNAQENLVVDQTKVSSKPPHSDTAGGSPKAPVPSSRR